MDTAIVDAAITGTVLITPLPSAWLAAVAVALNAGRSAFALRSLPKVLSVQGPAERDAAAWPGCIRVGPHLC